MALLSHYTTRAGLEGIANSGIFWATSLLDLNDTSEYFYAWDALLDGAKELFLPQVPAGVWPSTTSFEEMTKRVSDDLRSLLKKTDGVGHLYVTSFARTETTDQSRRGILTLWDRYTKHEGYCLQYDEGDLLRLLESERMFASYASLGLVPIEYGIDRDGRRYRELCFQLSQLFLRQTVKLRPNLGLSPDYQNLWPLSRLFDELLVFCAKHKDPCFEDEREIRIFAYPGDGPVVRPFMGLSCVKIRQRTEAGKLYIRLGEYMPSGFAPRRIVVGAKADTELTDIVTKFNPRPEVNLCDLPVR